MITYEKIIPFVLALVVFFQTVFPKLVPLAIIIWTVFVIIGIIKRKLAWSTNPLYIAFIALYFSYLAGVLYTQDTGLAKMYLENKLSFVLFPVLFSFKPKFIFSLRTPALGLIFGVLLISFWGIYKLLSCLASASVIDCFPYFSDVHHPSYFAVYILFSMALSIYGYIQKWKGFNRSSVFLFCIFGVIASFLAFSLSGILFLTITCCLLIWVWMKKKYGMKITFALTTGLFAVLFFFVTFSPLKEDFKYTSQSFSRYMESPEEFLKTGNRYLTGNEVRLIMWTVTAQLIAEHPFGVGTGNTDIYIEKKLQDYGLYDLASYKYNPHNQFLQTFLEVGIIGFLVFLFIIVISIRTAIKSKNPLLLIVAASLIFNCLFESMLQRQSGIIFYTFWMCLLYLYSTNKSNFTVGTVKGLHTI